METALLKTVFWKNTGCPLSTLNKSELSHEGRDENLPPFQRVLTLSFFRI